MLLRHKICRLSSWVQLCVWWRINSTQCHHHIRIHGCRMSRLRKVRYRCDLWILGPSKIYNLNASKLIRLCNFTRIHTIPLILFILLYIFITILPSYLYYATKYLYVAVRAYYTIVSNNNRIHNALWIHLYSINTA